MDKMIIYTHNSEILIVANADNVDLLCEYVGLLTKTPFPKCGFSCYIDNSENKIYAVSIRRGSVPLPKTLCNISHSKNKI